MKNLIGLVLTSVAALAATSTHTLTVFPTRTNWSVTNSIPQWNPADGTLNGVTITATVNASSSFRYENLDGVPQTAITSSEVTVTAAAGGSSVSAEANPTHTQTVTEFDGVADYQGTSAFRVTKTVAATQTGTVPSSPFVGTGTTPVIISSLGFGMYDGGGDYAFGVTTTSSALVVVTYDFTPVCPECDPEPGCDKGKDRDKDKDQDRDCDDRRKPRNKRR
jgi:hypothetical protein